MAFGNEKKLEKCEFELANDDPWTKTARGISKTMQEALKLMHYLPTKPEAKIWKRKLSKFIVNII